MAKKTFFNADSELRKKAVHLLYLVFLLLIFAFIPTHKNQNTLHGNLSINALGLALETSSTSNTLLFLHLLNTEPKLFAELKYKALEIEKIANYTISSISEIEESLIGDQDIETLDYDELEDQIGQTSSFINDHDARDLFKKLGVLKQSLDEILKFQSSSELNTILPLNKYEDNLKGEVVLAEHYFFKNRNLQTTLLNLAYFKSSVERLKSFAFQEVIKQIVFKNQNISAFQSIKLSENESLEDLYESRSIEDFFNKIDGIQLKKSDNTGSSAHYVESLTRGSISLGELVKFNVHFESIDNNQEPEKDEPLTVYVNTNRGKEYFSLPRSGEFFYYPKNKGLYTFQFDHQGIFHTETINVTTSQNIIGKSEPSILYTNVENELNISRLAFTGNYPIEATIENGTVTQRNNRFFAELDKPGKSILTLYALMPYGKTIIGQQEFHVSSYPALFAQIEDFEPGSNITVENAASLNHLNIVSNKDLGEVKLVEFEFVHIKNSYSSVDQPIKNFGAAFNFYIQRQLGQVQRGDLLLFNNIIVKSPSGKTTTLPSYSISVK